jgi:hypothetical protein
MVLLEDPPVSFAAKLAPEYVRVVEEGARLRARLPAYLARRRALLDEHSSLIPPLRDLVRDYDPEPTTTKEIGPRGSGRSRDNTMQQPPFYFIIHGANLLPHPLWCHFAASLACTRNATNVKFCNEGLLRARRTTPVPKLDMHFF